jgi:hypothetical protein
MAMLECYEPSLVAWRILSRKADAFMTMSEATDQGRYAKIVGSSPEKILNPIQSAPHSAPLDLGLLP